MPKKKTDKAEEKKVQTEEKLEEVESTENAEDVASATETEEVLDENQKKIKAQEEELALQKDKYMRLAAEYENYRKRSANEKLSIYDDATAKAVTELLPVADSMQMAMANMKEADPEVLKGIELISNQLAKSFEKLKVESYGKVGDVFDPNLHNAVMAVDDDNLESGTISEELQKGYMYKESVVRHSMVKVVN